MSHFCQLAVNLPYFLNPDVKSQYGAQYILLLKGKKLNIFSLLDLRYIFKFKFWKKEKRYFAYHPSVLHHMEVDEAGLCLVNMHYLFLAGMWKTGCTITI